MITYGDLFPYHKITLGDLVNYEILDEKYALKIIDLSELKTPNLFGARLHNLNIGRGNLGKKEFFDKLKKLFVDTEESYKIFLRILNNFRVTSDIVAFLDDFDSSIERFAVFNQYLSTRIPSYSHFSGKIERALKKYNNYLNPYFPQSDSNRAIEEYQITMETCIELESENEYLLEHLSEDLNWLNTVVFKEADDFLTLIKHPTALVHYYNLFGDFVDKFPLIIAMVAYNHETVPFYP